MPPLQVLNDSISATQWSRLQFYGNKIREISLLQDGKLDATVWLLVFFEAVGPLIPHLRRLDVSIKLPLYIPPLLFLSPSISHLTVRLTKEPEITNQIAQPLAQDLLQQMLKKAPNISTFILQEFPIDLPVDIGPSLLTLRYLEDVDITTTAVSYEALRQLSLSSVCPRRLSIKAPQRLGRSSEVFEGDIGKGLSSTTYLHLHGDVADMPQLLRAVPLPSLETLVITPLPIASLATFAEAAANLSSTIARRTLRAVQLEVHLTHIVHDDGLPTVHVPLTNILESLSCFAALKSLVVDASRYELYTVIDISDEDLRASTLAWPVLEELRIVQSDKRVPHLDTWTRPTASALYDVARNWRALKSFTVPGLSLAEGLPEENEQWGAVLAADTAGPAHSLREIELGHIAKETEWATMKLALLLDALFPRLGAVGPEQLGAGKDVMQWIWWPVSDGPPGQVPRIENTSMAPSLSDIRWFFVAAVRAGRTGSIGEE